MQDEPRPFPHNQYNNILGEYNPTHWDVDESDARTRGEVNTYDRVARTDRNVPGHALDHDPDMSRERAHVLAEQGEFDDLPDDAPLPLLESDMSASCTEGVQGSFKVVIELSKPCPDCRSRYGIRACASTLGSVYSVYCLDPNCDYLLEQP